MWRLSFNSCNPSILLPPWLSATLSELQQPSLWSFWKVAGRSSSFSFLLICMTPNFFSFFFSGLRCARSELLRTTRWRLSLEGVWRWGQEKIRGSRRAWRAAKAQKLRGSWWRVAPAWMISPCDRWYFRSVNSFRADRCRRRPPARRHGAQFQSWSSGFLRWQKKKGKLKPVWHFVCRKWCNTRLFGYCMTSNLQLADIHSRRETSIL